MVLYHPIPIEGLVLYPSIPIEGLVLYPCIPIERLVLYPCIPGTLCYKARNSSRIGTDKLTVNRLSHNP